MERKVPSHAERREAQEARVENRAQREAERDRKQALQRQSSEEAKARARGESVPQLAKPAVAVPPPPPAVKAD